MDPVRRRVLADGLVAGFLAYVVVVVFISAVEVLAGHSPFRTVSLLGEVILRGADAPAGAIDPAAVISYNGIHLTAFLILGFVAAWLEHETELHPWLWYIPFFVLLAASLYAFSALLVVNRAVSEAIPAWMFGIATVLGWATVVGWLAAARRRRAVAAAAEEVSFDI
jgi:hypothetical protein